jgi:hypothetical protein
MHSRTRATLAGIFILVAYLVVISFLTIDRWIVMLADVISGLAVIGIAVMVYPFVKKEKTALTYLTLKYTEGALMVLSGLLFLIPALQYTRDIIYNGIHVYIFIISAFIFYYLLYKRELIPRWISVWGALGILALTVSTVLGLLQVELAVLDYFLALIITNEVFLAIWLMVKGFQT